MVASIIAGGLIEESLPINFTVQKRVQPNSREFGFSSGLRQQHLDRVRGLCCATKSKNISVQLDRLQTVGHHRDEILIAKHNLWSGLPEDVTQVLWKFTTLVISWATKRFAYKPFAIEGSRVFTGAPIVIAANTIGAKWWLFRAANPKMSPLL